MNYSIVRYVIGRLMLIEAGLMFIPLIVGLIYREGLMSLRGFLIAIFLLALCGWLFSRRKPSNSKMYFKEGMVIVALCWLLWSVFGAIPFYFSGQIPSVIDAVFEMASGFTTTGSTILNNVESLSHSITFWRSFSHLIGGMGVLVFALAVLPGADSETVHLMKAEVPGPVFGKLVSRLRNTARILYLIYLAMTLIVTVLLLLGGMNLFDALIHAFGAAGTGGFSNRNASIGHYNSVYIEIVLGLSMIAFGINFNLYYMILIRQTRRALKSEELRWYLSIISGAIVLIFLANLSYYVNWAENLRNTFFTVASIVTTTGYTTANFNAWPLVTHSILLILMFVGSCAGSTAGGLKISRIGILFKAARNEVLRMNDPRRILVVNYEGKRLLREQVTHVRNYFLVYIFLYTTMVALMTIDTPDFMSAFSAVAATFNNIGPGLEVVGPTSNFAAFRPFSKIVLIFAMIAGRLEIYPMLALFLPGFLRRSRRPEQSA